MNDAEKNEERKAFEDLRQLDIELEPFLLLERNEQLKKVESAYKKKALKTHPDKGGDAEAFKALANTKESLKDYIKSICPFPSNSKKEPGNEKQMPWQIWQDYFIPKNQIFTNLNQEEKKALQGKENKTSPFARYANPRNELFIKALSNIAKYRLWLANVFSSKASSIKALCQASKNLRLTLNQQFQLAAIIGNIDLLKHLFTHYPDKYEEMIRANHYAAFCDAARYGHVDVIHFLMEKAPQLNEEMIQADNYLVFRDAIELGNKAVISCLFEKAPRLKEKMMLLHAKEYLFRPYSNLLIIDVFFQQAFETFDKMPIPYLQQLFLYLGKNKDVKLQQKLLNISSLYKCIDEESSIDNTQIDTFTHDYLKKLKSLAKVQPISNDSFTLVANSTELTVDLTLCQHMLHRIIRQQAIYSKDELLTLINHLHTKIDIKKYIQLAKDNKNQMAIDALSKLESKGGEKAFNQSYQQIYCNLINTFIERIESRQGCFYIGQSALQINLLNKLRTYIESTTKMRQERVQNPAAWLALIKSICLMKKSKGNFFSDSLESQLKNEISQKPEVYGVKNYQDITDFSFEPSFLATFHQSKGNCSIDNQVEKAEQLQQGSLLKRQLVQLISQLEVRLKHKIDNQYFAHAVRDRLKHDALEVIYSSLVTGTLSDAWLSSEKNQAKLLSIIDGVCSFKRNPFSLLETDSLNIFKKIIQKNSNFKINELEKNPPVKLLDAIIESGQAYQVSSTDLKVEIEKAMGLVDDKENEHLRRIRALQAGGYC